MKTLLLALTLLATTLALPAQYAFRHDSLGVTIDFPCQPEPMNQSVEAAGGTVQVEGYLCQQGLGSAYMFAFNPMEGMVQSPELVRMALKGGQSGLTGKLQAKVKGEKYVYSAGISVLSFNFSSKSTGFSGSAKIMYGQGLLLQQVYMTNSKPDKKAWARFSNSFRMRGM